MAVMGDTDIFCLHVEIKTVVPAIPTDAAHFHASEGRGQIPIVL